MKTKTIAGLHLWAVKVSYIYHSSRVTTDLWITTAKDSIADANTKALRFLERDGDFYQQPVIKEIRNHGTIDA